LRGSIAKDYQKTPKQVALARLLKRSPVTLPFPGTSSIEHLEENMQAALLRLTDEEYREVTNVSEQPPSFRS
jgi:pyridoxine 4-dehydrogenase